MRVLVTGGTGLIGKFLADLLRQEGHTVRTFDLRAPDTPAGEHITGDLRDKPTVRRAVEGMDAVAHLGAIPDDWKDHDDDVIQVNVLGTWNVLHAAAESGIRRVVAFSSVQSLGNFAGYRYSEILPIDDAYPRHPMSAYQISKHLNEETCRYFARRYDMTAVCFRPVGVWRPTEGEENARYHQEDPAGGTTGYWSYVDVRDVCEAARLGLTVPDIGYDAFLLAADDSTSRIPTAELVARFFPDTPWQTDPDAYFAANPYRSLVDCSHAKQVLGWQPKHSWRDAASDS